MQLVEVYNFSYFEIQNARFTDFCKLMEKISDRVERQTRKHAGDNWF